MRKVGGGPLARFVRGIMEAKGLKLEEVARIGDLDPSYVSLITSGKSRNPSASKIKGLAKGLGIDAHQVLDVAAGIKRGASGEWLEQPDSPDVGFVLELMQSVVANPGLMEIMEKATTLSPEKQSILVEVVRDFKARQTGRSGKSSRKG